MRKEQKERCNEVIGRVGLMDGKGLVVRWIVDEVNDNIRSVLGHALPSAIILSFFQQIVSIIYKIDYKKRISLRRSHGFQKLQLSNLS